MPDYGFGALSIGTGAQLGLQEMIRRRLQERQMALAEQAQRENAAFRNRDLDLRAKEGEEDRALREATLAQSMADRQQAGIERFAAKDVEATPIGRDITRQQASLWAEGGQGGVVRNALHGTVTDPEVGGERPAMALFRGYSAPEAEKVNAYAQQEQDRDEAAKQRSEDQRNLVKLTASLRPPAGGAGATQLSPEALDMAAQVYAKTGQLVSLGMGAANDRKMILNRAAQLFPGTDVAGSGAEYKSDLASLTQLTKRIGAIKPYAAQAVLSLDNVRKASATVPRTGSPLVNRYKNWVSKNLTGQAPLSQFEVYAYNAARDYARVTAGGAESIAQMTDAASAAADALLNTAQNPEQIDAVIEAMKNDMANTTTTLEQQLADTRSKIRTKPGQTPAPATQSPSPAVANAPGRVYYDANGNPIKR